MIGCSRTDGYLKSRRRLLDFFRFFWYIKRKGIWWRFFAKTNFAHRTTPFLENPRSDTYQHFRHFWFWHRRPIPSRIRLYHHLVAVGISLFWQKGQHSEPTFAIYWFAWVISERRIPGEGETHFDGLTFDGWNEVSNFLHPLINLTDLSTEDAEDTYRRPKIEGWRGRN